MAVFPMGSMEQSLSQCIRQCVRFPDEGDRHDIMVPMSNTFNSDIESKSCGDTNGAGKSFALSVIVPVYNSGQFLDNFFKFMLAQSFRDFELICVNDGSTDGSLRLIEKYAQADSRIKIISQKNKGAGAARNSGLDAAQGKYLIFMDSDDFPEISMLGKMYEAVSGTGSDICVCRSDSYNVKNGKYYPHTRSFVKEYIPEKRVFSYKDAPDHIFNMFRGWPWDKMYNAEFIRRSGLRFQEIENQNDVLFVYLSLVLATRITTVDKVLIHKSEHIDESISGSGDKDWRCIFTAYRGLKDELISHGLYDEVSRSFAQRVLRNFVWNLGVLSGRGREEFYAAVQGYALDEFGIDPEADAGFFDAQSDIEDAKHIAADSLADYLSYRAKKQDDERARRRKSLKSLSAAAARTVRSKLSGRR